MSSLRTILAGVPQDPTYHPEGDVWVHTKAVRNALVEALALVNASDVSKRIWGELQIGRPERNLLRLAAWCHDLGKASATQLQDGRWRSPRHERAEHFNRVARRLGPPWRKMWSKSSFADRKDFVYLVSRHMAISDARGLEPRLPRSLNSTDTPRRRRAQLALVFMMMDRLGCASPSRFDDARLVMSAAEALSLLPSKFLRGET